MQRLWAVRVLALSAVIIGGALTMAAAIAFDNLNMGTTLDVENGSLVARWSTEYDHYNIRLVEDGKFIRQVERDGDKNFLYVTTFRRGVIYRVAVQGCDKSFAGSSTCTSWDEASCGDAHEPCDGPPPRPIVNGTRLCLDVDAANQKTNGARVQLWACNGSDQQLWFIRGGRVVSFAGKCLDLAFPDLRKNGGHIQVWDCNGSIQQHWAPRDGGLRNGGGKCLDVATAPDGNGRNGDVAQVWDCNGSVRQRWGQLDTL